MNIAILVTIVSVDAEHNISSLEIAAVLATLGTPLHEILIPV